MYLKAIELHGFKSFPEKTKIEFEKGMSAVVGPNGSGKSNISDAIRWVLGETSSRQLRSGGKMEDIIFGGTRRRNPMGFASVSLVLDNSDSSFDIEGDEVSVTRKYYRGGDSEYYINGARVRLRDVQELFFDTGLGKNGYSIVGQGRISEIVTSRPEGRREIFEEASGIAKFRFKKNEAERKLEAAEGNILRLNDILTSLEERVGPLERESKKAQEFLKLARERKSLEISLWIDQVDKSAEQIRNRQRRLEIFNRDYENVSRQLEESERYLEERYAYANSLLARSDENRAAIRQAEADIGRISAEGAAAQGHKGFASARIEELEREKELILSQSRGAADRQREIENKIKAIQLKIDENRQMSRRLGRQLAEQTRMSARQGDEKGRLTGLISTVNLQIQQSRIDSAAHNSARQAALRANESDKESLAKAQEYIAGLEKQADDLKEYSQHLEDEITRTGNIKKGLSMKYDSAQSKVQSAQKAARDCLAKGRQISDRIKLLKDMEDSLEGFAGSVKAVLARARQGGLGGILGSVAQLITVEKGYETAVEVALGYALQNIVTENESSAKRAIEYLKTSRGGRATFLPLDTVKPSNFNEKLPDYARTGDSVIKADSKYKNIISSLLGRTIIVDDINTASNLARKLNYRYRIVTLDGQIVNAGGSFTGGSVNRSAGLFTRKSEIERLTKQQSELREQYKKLEDESTRADTALRAVVRQIEGRDAEISSLSTDKAGCDIEFARIEQSLSGYRTTAENLKAGIEQRSQQAQKARQDMENLARREKELADKLKELTARLESLGEKEGDYARRMEELAGKIQSARLEQVNLQGQLNLEQNNLARIAANISERAERRHRIDEDITSLKEEMRAKEAEIQTGEEKIQSLRRRIQSLEEENRSFVSQRLEIEARRTKLSAENKTLASQKEDLSGQAAKLEERIHSMETGYEDIITRLWQEYELTVETARPLRQPVEDEHGLTRQLTSLRNAIRRLGNVNVGAIEEYKEVSERYTYLKGQLSDLAESKAQLIKLITSLSAEMRELFKKGFDRINSNFGRIFTELFGGGNASLALTDTEDILSAGIEIKVNPPGKVIKSLTALSGGEQSLVAIAIYLAILDYNPAPFCVLDEIEAALDDVNVARYAAYLHRISDRTQFIVITHRRGTMEAADILYGVTMQEDGISKLLKLDSVNLAPSVLN